MSPRLEQNEESLLHRSVFRYEWRHLNLAPKDSGEGEETATVRIGDEVWMKSPDARCTMQWEKGRITGVHSRNNVSVDGMPRHILDGGDGV